MSEKLFDSVMVESDGYAFPVKVQYERYPGFCSNCKMIDHSIQSCNKLINMTQENVSKITKKVHVEVPNSKQTRQGAIQKEHIAASENAKEVHSNSQAHVMVEFTTGSKVNNSIQVETVHMNKEVITLMCLLLIMLPHIRK